MEHHKTHQNQILTTQTMFKPLLIAGMLGVHVVNVGVLAALVASVSVVAGVALSVVAGVALSALAVTNGVAVDVLRAHHLMALQGALPHALVEEYLYLPLLQVRYTLVNVMP